VVFRSVVQGSERVPQVGGGAQRTQGVVLVHDWNAEDSHDSVADELLNRAALALEACSCNVEVARHHTAERLWVELLAERRRAGHIGEQDSHRLTHLAARRGREPGAARRAEARTFSILLAAAWARHHAQKRTTVGVKKPTRGFHAALAAPKYVVRWDVGQATQKPRPPRLRSQCVSYSGTRITTRRGSSVGRAHG